MPRDVSQSFQFGKRRRDRHSRHADQFGQFLHLHLDNQTLLGIQQALAIGLQMGPLQRPAPATDPSAVAAGSTLPSTALVDESSVATLDENPDLYLWLASSDADLVALEY